MFSAIVMAGYNNKWGVRKYAKSVAEHYGEKFIETGYKPLREFETYEKGQLVRKPLILFTLEILAEMDHTAEFFTSENDDESDILDEEDSDDDFFEEDEI